MKSCIFLTRNMKKYIKKKIKTIFIRYKLLTFWLISFYRQFFLFCFLWNWPYLFHSVSWQETVILFDKCRIDFWFLAPSPSLYFTHTHTHRVPNILPLVFYVLSKYMQTEWIQWPGFGLFPGQSQKHSNKL